MNKVLLPLPLLVLGCTQLAPQAEPVEITKAEAVEAMSQGSTIDFCEWLGWYGDGICDEFCAQPDPDCTPAEPECVVSGCSGEICAAESMFSTCEFKPESICLENAVCEVQASGACGFTLSAEDQECLDQVQAGEDVFMTILPTQCGTNAWEKDAVTNEDFAHLGFELQHIAGYFDAKGIVIKELGLVNHTTPIAVCKACHCPRGDRLVVKVSPLDAQLLRHEGFTTLKGAAGTAPTQCGTNAWEEFGSETPELELLADWAEGEGAPLAEAGFLVSVQPKIVCAACSCPRGDFLVALPAAGSDASVLGFEAL